MSNLSLPCPFVFTYIFTWIVPRILGSSAKLKKQLQRLKENEKQRRQNYEDQLGMLKAQLNTLKKRDAKEADM